jgi:hypothetical protein
LNPRPPEPHCGRSRIGEVLVRQAKSVTPQRLSLLFDPAMPWTSIRPLRDFPVLHGGLVLVTNTQQRTADVTLSANLGPSLRTDYGHECDTDSHKYYYEATKA